MTGTLIQQLTTLADAWEKSDRHESALELRRIIEQYVSASPVMEWDIETPHIPTLNAVVEWIDSAADVVKLPEVKGTLQTVSDCLKSKIAELEGGK